MSDSSAPSPSAPQPNPQPRFYAESVHMNKPRLRPVRGFSAQGTSSDGTEMPMIGLADTQQISDKVVFTQAAAMHLLPLMDGSRTIDELVDQVGKGLTRLVLENLVAQLDEAGLLEGPTFEAMVTEMRRQFDAAANLPPASTIQFAESLLSEDEQKLPETERDVLSAAKLREAFDSFIKQAIKDAPDASLQTLPKGIVVPHLDYARGWMNYAAMFGRLREAARPDRVLILGTNHFGRSTGVAACDKGYVSPFGVSELAGDLLAAIQTNLGDDLAGKLMANRYDHEREHSIELQIPWIQHIFGEVDGAYPKVLGVLIHDPTVSNGESYDGNGVGLEQFVAATKQAIAALPGKTLVISSADLAHVGPSFGDQVKMADQEGEGAEFRQKVIQADIDLLKQFTGMDPNSADQSAMQRASGLVASVAWQGNANRWCSIGNMTAAMMIAEPQETRLLNYAAAIDPEGMTMVSSCAIAMM